MTVDVMDGHVTRKREKMHFCERVLEGKPEGKRSFGSTKPNN